MIKKLFIFFIIFASTANAIDLGFKDNLKSSLMTFVVSTYFQSRGYGKVDSIKYDTEKKHLFVELSPEGETQKLRIDIDKLEFTQEKENNQPVYFLLLKNLKTNRIWLNRILADTSAEGLKIPITAQNYMVLSALL